MLSAAIEIMRCRKCAIKSISFEKYKNGRYNCIVCRYIVELKIFIVLFFEKIEQMNIITEKIFIKDMQILCPNFKNFHIIYSIVKPQKPFKFHFNRITMSMLQ